MCTWTYIIATCCVSSIIFYACQSSYDSVSSSLKLPAPSRGSAAGYDEENNIILIFGGDDRPQQFIQFKNNEFIHYDSSYIPSTQSIAGWGQSHFQLNNTLWILNQQGKHFITASTHPPYDVTFPNITIPILVDNNGCLAMTHHHIFIVGGATTDWCVSRDSVQIYDMINGEWLSGVPSLPTNRMNVACYAVDDTLYAIGGLGGDHVCNPSYDSILTLNISDAALTDIASQQWQVVPSTLHTPSYGSCIVKHNTDLIVIGGYDIDTHELKDVNVINTITGECSLAGTLSIGTVYPACIIHRSTDTLYIFGGLDETDRWQFINLPTMDPTAHHDPTTNPTNSPLRDTTEYTNTVTTAAAHDTAGGSTESNKSPKRDPHLTMDELVTVFVVVSGSLCLIIVFAIICRIFKNGKKEERKILDLNHNIAAMNNNVKIANNNEEDIDPGPGNEVIVDDSVVMAYTNEGDNPTESNHIIQAVNKTDGCSDIINEGKNKDVVVMAYTNEGPQYNEKDIALQKKIWNSEVQLVNMEYSSSKAKVLQDKTHSNRLELQTWLQNEVGLPQYFEVLFTNGYESMHIIKDISNSRELKDIGIESKQHQMTVMEEIYKWKNKARETQD